MKIQLNGMEVDVQENDIVTASWSSTDKTLQVLIVRNEEIVFCKEESYK